MGSGMMVVKLEVGKEMGSKMEMEAELGLGIMAKPGVGKEVGLEMEMEMEAEVDLGVMMKPGVGKEMGSNMEVKGKWVWE